MEKLSKELIGASSIPIILSILSKNESYGYEIIQNVKEISNGKIEYGDGTLYPVLHKLEKKNSSNLIGKWVNLEEKESIIKLVTKEKSNFYQKKKTGQLSIKLYLNYGK